MRSIFRVFLLGLFLSGSFALLAPAPAAAQCNPGYKLCPDHLGGGCAPIGSICCAGGKHVTSGRCPRTSGGSYGAIAVALWRESSGRSRVAVGVGWKYRSLSEASRSAMSQCQGRGGQGCRVVTTFSNGGCGYVATGSSSNGVSYGTGATPRIALSECRKNGHSCSRAIGGCTVR
ncbi:MAG: DUF4189 domain-containing protein [Hyphomicrobiaceae bacterium]|nr:DUF4189 domain-containing protein [Hyphomicrobiaceae bacterium]